VPDHTWCYYPNAKKIADLIKEIELGESMMAVEMGRLVRILYGIGPNIYYIHPDGNRQRLVETKRVYADGHVETRTLSTSLGEKMPLGETAEQALVRALKEELGMNVTLTDLVYTQLGTVTSECQPASYPGLTTRYHIVRVDVTLNDAQYRPNGYTEVKNGRTTYFEWVDSTP
jgi:8-oxo-dGTP pyrophosphatase MutT (NUDIX family)